MRCPSQHSSPSGNADPCADQPVCSGYHRQVHHCSNMQEIVNRHVTNCRCLGAATGFLQCQPKPGSETVCQTGPNCLPECVGQEVGREGDDCALQPVENCGSSYVRRGSRATQCRVSKGGNPSGADLCENWFLCGI